MTNSYLHPLFKCLKTLRSRFRNRPTRAALSFECGNDPLAYKVGCTDLVWCVGHDLLIPSSRRPFGRVGSVAREVISKYTAEEVYTSRDAIQFQVRARTQKSLGANLDKLVQPEATEQPDPKHYNDFLQGSIQILDILVLSIERPPAVVVDAINSQTAQFYMIQVYNSGQSEPRSRNANRSRPTA